MSNQLFDHLAFHAHIGFSATGFGLRFGITLIVVWIAVVWLGVHFYRKWLRRRTHSGR